MGTSTTKSILKLRLYGYVPVSRCKRNSPLTPIDVAVIAMPKIHDCIQHVYCIVAS